jgi:hypothetical protein
MLFLISFYLFVCLPSMLTLPPMKVAGKPHTHTHTQREREKKKVEENVRWSAKQNGFAFE